jgi:phosphoglycolate phosphatase
VEELPHAAEKPNPEGLRRILEDFRLEPDEVLLVGDNVKKDMPVAQECGVLGVWAEYGTYVSSEYRARLSVISAKAVTRRHVADETPARWPLSISSFTQVIEVLDGARWVQPPARARRTPKKRRRSNRNSPMPR